MPSEQHSQHDEITRACEFARGLAEGVNRGDWENRFGVTRHSGSKEVWGSLSLQGRASTKLRRYIEEDWDGNPPRSELLQSLGYLIEFHGPRLRNPSFRLTPKACALLEEKKPARALQVFISYKHTESAGLATFLEDQLEKSDLNVEVFTDSKIKKGDRWKLRLAQKIRDCDYFVFLFCKETLFSKWVMKEIEWAQSFSRYMIPVWHKGYKGEGDYPADLREFQEIRVHEENKKHFNYAFDDLLDTLKDPPPQLDEEILSLEAIIDEGKPPYLPKVFISYKVSESSTFASLIEARLKLADPNIEIFIDKMLAAGDEWEQRIERAVRSCDIFICLFGPSTLASLQVQREIDWALVTGSRIIPVLHNGFRGDMNYPVELEMIQWIQVEKEVSEDYEIAILQILSALGFTTVSSPQ